MLVLILFMCLCYKLVASNIFIFPLFVVKLEWIGVLYTPFVNINKKNYTFKVTIRLWCYVNFVYLILNILELVARKSLQEINLPT